MPDRAGLIFVIAGVAMAAVAAMILRRRTERREYSAQLRNKGLSVEVIRSSEALRTGAVAPPAGEAPWPVQDDPGYRAAVRKLRADASSAEVKATLSALEQARQRVLVAVAARDADVLRDAVRSLDEAVEKFAAASSVMVRLA